MSWNHRLVQVKDDTIMGDGMPALEPELMLCEVYYDKNGKPDGFDPTPFIRGSTPAQIREVLKCMEECLDKPVIDMDELSGERGRVQYLEGLCREALRILQTDMLLLAEEDDKADDLIEQLKAALA